VRHLNNINQTEDLRKIGNSKLLLMASFDPVEKERLRAKKLSIHLITYDPLAKLLLLVA
jgi:hypothetical protein